MRPIECWNEVTSRSFIVCWSWSIATRTACSKGRTSFSQPRSHWCTPHRNIWNRKSEKRNWRLRTSSTDWWAWLGLNSAAKWSIWPPKGVQPQVSRNPGLRVHFRRKTSICVISWKNIPGELWCFVTPSIVLEGEWTSYMVRIHVFEHYFTIHSL